MDYLLTTLQRRGFPRRRSDYQPIIDKAGCQTIHVPDLPPVQVCDGNSPPLARGVKMATKHNNHTMVEQHYFHAQQPHEGFAQSDATQDLHINEVQQEVLPRRREDIGRRRPEVDHRPRRRRLPGRRGGHDVRPVLPVLMIGRLLAGIGIGFGVMIAPVYIAEISPAASRGSFTSFPEIFINLGILLGYISNYAFSGLPDHINWRVMLAVGILPSVSIAFALLVIPESPRWLVMQNRADEARAVLLKVTDSEDEAKERLAEIEAAAAATNAG
ncbi:hypothetical protein HU200_058031 [Digitaria exilis]|uniref:Major facilitator superfamily (MFS) profile domain-containing protein n=1 Tax=Digitaria exilis TaxID=1010633 RepID=A0A835E2C2_9POAL|nr:hypothetical protein HU200_058031 [Digitaria exilis]